MNKFLLSICLSLALVSPSYSRDMSIDHLGEISYRNLYGIRVSKLCIDGYEYIVVHKSRGITMIQCYERVWERDSTGNSRTISLPKRCHHSNKEMINEQE